MFSLGNGVLGINGRTDFIQLDAARYLIAGCVFDLQFQLIAVEAESTVGVLKCRILRGNLVAVFRRAFFNGNIVAGFNSCLTFLHSI